MAAGARKLTLEETLPQSGDQGLLVGRAWLPGERGGPTVVLVRGGRLFDVSAAAPTISALLEVDDLPAALRTAHGRDLGPLEEWLQSTSDHGPDPARRHLLAPNDLQVVKAAGVTFVGGVGETDVDPSDYFQRHGYTVAEVQADEPSTVADAAKPKKKISEKDGE